MAQITGKVIEFLPIVEGENEKGRWMRSGFVIMPLEGYSDPVCISVFGAQHVDSLQPLKIGQVVIVNYRPQSRKVGDKWFTDIKCQSVAYAVNAPLGKGGDNAG